jgi:hypothetical protein
MSQFLDLATRRRILGLEEDSVSISFQPQTEREEALKQWLFSLEFENEELSLEALPHRNWDQKTIEQTRQQLLNVMEQTKEVSPDVCSAFLQCYSLLNAFSGALRDNDTLRIVLQDYLNERGHNAQARAYEAQAAKGVTTPNHAQETPGR